MKKLILLLLMGFSLNIYAQDNEKKKKTADEIAKEMSNPTLPMFNFQAFYTYSGMVGTLTGADAQSTNLFALQPPFPFTMKNGKSLIIRPLFSFHISQPIFSDNGFESAGSVHFGDIPIDILYSGTNKETGFMFGYGAVTNIPTASSAAIRGEWRLGPSLLIGSMKKYIFLLIVNNSFQLTGENKSAILGGQYVMAFGLGKGWQFVSSPPWSYNWKTKALTLPIGGGPFKTIMMGKTPVKLGLQVNYYISQPESFGQQWGVKLSITPRLPTPW